MHWRAHRSKAENNLRKWGTKLLSIYERPGETILSKKKKTVHPRKQFTVHLKHFKIIEYRITSGLRLKCSTNFPQKLVKHHMKNLATLVLWTTCHETLEACFWITPPRKKSRIVLKNWKIGTPWVLMVRISWILFILIFPYLWQVFNRCIKKQLFSNELIIAKMVNFSQKATKNCQKTLTYQFLNTGS